MFIMIDGIDGSGKSTIVEAWREFLISQKKIILSLKDFWREHGRHPNAEEIGHADIIFSAEPTTVWVGAALREEMIIQSTEPYSTESVATAFSLDRLILYKRVLLPARKKEKLIIQDRGITSSIAYQPIQTTLLPLPEAVSGVYPRGGREGVATVTLDFILSLEGNRFALENTPDVLVLTACDPTVALARLETRTKKQDNAIFERLDFEKQLAETYASDWFKKIFEDRGTKVVMLDTNVGIDAMRQKAVELLRSLMNGDRNI